MAAIQNHTGHSAIVKMHLVVDGRRLRIGQMGPNYLIMDDTLDHPPGEAEIIFSVDGRVEQWTVRLPNGLRSDQNHVLVSR